MYSSDSVWVKLFQQQNVNAKNITFEGIGLQEESIRKG